MLDRLLMLKVLLFPQQHIPMLAAPQEAEILTKARLLLPRIAISYPASQDKAISPSGVPEPPVGHSTQEYVADA